MNKINISKGILYHGEYTVSDTTDEQDPCRVVIMMPRPLVEKLDEEWKRRLYESRSDLVRQLVAESVGYDLAAI